MPLVRNVNQTQTDSGTRDANISMTNKNGVVKTTNNLTGTTRYGSTTNPVGTLYYGGTSAQNALRKRYNGALGDNGNPGSSGGSGNTGGGGGGDFSFHTNTNDDIINMIKGLLTEQKNKADEYYRTMYENQVAQNRQGFESNRNQINRNFKRGERYINSIYGNENSGQGITNKLRNRSNWENNLTSNRMNLENNNAQALAGYNSNLANTANTLAQGWYNYVLPVYENRQINSDNINTDYAYKRYLASL